MLRILGKLRENTRDLRNLQERNQQLEQSQHILRASHHRLDVRNTLLTKTGNELLEKSKTIKSENKQLTASNADLSKRLRIREQQVQEMQISMQNQGKQISRLQNSLEKAKSKEKQMEIKYQRELKAALTSKANKKSTAESTLIKMKVLVRGEHTTSSLLSDEDLYQLFKDQYQSLGSPKAITTPAKKKRKKRQTTKEAPALSSQTRPNSSPADVSTPAKSMDAMPFKSSFQVVQGTLQRNVRAAPFESPPNIYLSSPSNSPLKPSVPALPLGVRTSPSKRAYRLDSSPSLCFRPISVDDSSLSIFGSNRLGVTDLYENQGSPLGEFGNGTCVSSFDSSNEFTERSAGLGLDENEQMPFSNLDSLETTTGLNLTPARTKESTDIDILPQSQHKPLDTGFSKQNLLPDMEGFKERKNGRRKSEQTAEVPDVPVDCVCLLAYKDVSPPAWVSKALRYGHHIDLHCKYQKFTPSVCGCTVRGAEGEHTNNLCPVYQNEECSLCKQMLLTTKNVQHQRHLGNRCGGWRWKQNLYKQIPRRVSEEGFNEGRFGKGQQPEGTPQDLLHTLQPDAGTPALPGTA